jgi:hypothetical protein
MAMKLIANKFSLFRIDVFSAREIQTQVLEE